MCERRIVMAKMLGRNELGIGDVVVAVVVAVFVAVITIGFSGLV